MRKTYGIVLLLTLGACGTPGGFMSPGTAGAPSVGTTVAQTARDQSTVPGTSTGGTGSGNIYNQFAATVPPEVALRMLEVAEAQNWTADQVTSAFKALAGAPTTVTISGDQTNTASGGDAENLGAGSGGSGAASGGSVDRP
jgi:hypothetical protein